MADAGANHHKTIQNDSNNCIQYLGRGTVPQPPPPVATPLVVRTCWFQTARHCCPPVPHAWPGPQRDRANSD